MVHATIKLLMPRAKIAEAFDILRSVVEQLRSLPGCVGCALYQSVIDPNVIMFEEDWESENDLDRQIASDRYRDILLLMEMASEPPEVKFIPIPESSGMDRIVKIRGGET